MEEEIINEFTSIKGVDRSTAKALYEAGYTSIIDLNDATAEELAGINDISEQLAEEIKNDVSRIYDIKTDTGVEESAQDVAGTTELEIEEGLTEVDVEEFEAEAVTEAEEEFTEEAEPVPEIKLELDPKLQRLLKVRKKQKAKKPDFLQTDSHKKKRLKNYWRRPRGLHNKKRRYILGKGSIARVGYGSPTAVKGLHPSGFQDVMIHTVQDLNELDPATQAVRIARTVGQRKRMEIVNKARSLGLKILNPPLETVTEEVL